MNPRIRSIPMTSLATCLISIFGYSDAFADPLIVTSCLDDNGAGTLRSVLAAAHDGDSIFLDQLTACVNSTVTLTKGQLSSNKNVTLIGPTLPGGAMLSVDAASASRVIDHTGTYINIDKLIINHGYVHGDQSRGGCVRSSGTVSLYRSTVDSCIAGSSSGNADGGAVYADTLSMSHSTISHSQAIVQATGPLAHGGAAYVKTMLQCAYSTISGNAATGPLPGMHSGGGGIYTKGSVTLDRCTVDSNRAFQAGGMLVNGNASYLQIHNSTISSNSAYNAWGGVAATGKTVVTNSTFAFNAAACNCGNGLQASNVTLQSSIFASNTPNDFAGYGTLAGADNLIMTSNITSVPVGSPNLIVSSADPRLTPLAFHGGSTRVLALLETSPALDNGNAQLQAFDQRGFGFARSVNANADIGAYERQANDDEIFYDGLETQIPPIPE